MNTTMVSCFLAAADYHSITKAAAKLFFAQQTVSRNIDELENELGVALLRRSRTGVELTRIGAYYYALLQDSAYNINKLRAEIAEIYRDMDTRLRVGFSEWVNPYGELYTTISSFIGEHPLTHLSTRIYDNETLFSELGAGELDLVILSEGHLPASCPYNAAALCREQLCLLGPDTVIGEELALAQREKREQYPLLITPGWDRGYLENITYSRLDAANLRPPVSKIQLVSSFPSQCVMMESLRYLAFSDRRFGFMTDIPGIASESIPVESHLYCCYPPEAENENTISLIEHLKKALQP